MWGYFHIANTYEKTNNVFFCPSNFKGLTVAHSPELFRAC